MKRNEKLESAQSPDGTVLSLHRHDGTYYMKADNVELMSTRRHASEDRLAELVCVPIAERGVRDATVLIGGLGLGFTLRAALASLPADARVVVAEIVAEVIHWNADRKYRISIDAMRDPRVDVRHTDVADVIRENAGRFDGIMLDVDNGAEAMTSAGNSQLYDAEGIRAAASALRPGGLLAYWSSVADPGFARALRSAGLDVAETRVGPHAKSRGGRRHSIYVCANPSTTSPDRRDVSVPH